MIFYNISAGMCFLASIITKSEMFFIGGIIFLDYSPEVRLQ